MKKYLILLFSFLLTIPAVSQNQSNNAFIYPDDGVIDAFLCPKVDNIVYSSLNADITVCVYSLNGTLVFKNIVRKNGEYAFPLSNLNAGVYMVNVNGLTYKIVKI